MRPENLGFEDCDLDPIFRILEKRTQTFNNNIHRKPNNAGKLPLPRDFNLNGQSVEVYSHTVTKHDCNGARQNKANKLCEESKSRSNSDCKYQSSSKQSSSENILIRKSSSYSCLSEDYEKRSADKESDKLTNKCSQIKDGVSTNSTYSIVINPGSKQKCLQIKKKSSKNPKQKTNILEGTSKAIYRNKYHKIFGNSDSLKKESNYKDLIGNQTENSSISEYGKKVKCSKKYLDGRLNSSSNCYLYVKGFKDICKKPSCKNKTSIENISANSSESKSLNKNYHQNEYSELQVGSISSNILPYNIAQDRSLNNCSKKNQSVEVYCKDKEVKRFPPFIVQRCEMCVHKKCSNSDKSNSDTSSYLNSRMEERDTEDLRKDKSYTKYPIITPSSENFNEKELSHFKKQKNFCRDASYEKSVKENCFEIQSSAMFNDYQTASKDRQAIEDFCKQSREMVINKKSDSQNDKDKYLKEMCKTEPNTESFEAQVGEKSNVTSIHPKVAETKPIEFGSIEKGSFENDCKENDKEKVNQPEQSNKYSTKQSSDSISEFELNLFSPVRSISNQENDYEDLSNKSIKRLSCTYPNDADAEAEAEADADDLEQAFCEVLLSMSLGVKKNSYNEFSKDKKQNEECNEDQSNKLMTKEKCACIDKNNCKVDQDEQSPEVYVGDTNPSNNSSLCPNIHDKKSDKKFPEKQETFEDICREQERERLSKLFKDSEKDSKDTTKKKCGCPKTSEGKNSKAECNKKQSKECFKVQKGKSSTVSIFCGIRSIEMEQSKEDIYKRKMKERCQLRKKWCCPSKYSSDSKSEFESNLSNSDKTSLSNQENIGKEESSNTIERKESIFKKSNKTEDLNQLPCEKKLNKPILGERNSSNDYNKDKDLKKDVNRDKSNGQNDGKKYFLKDNTENDNTNVTSSLCDDICKKENIQKYLKWKESFEKFCKNNKRFNKLIEDSECSENFLGDRKLQSDLSSSNSKESSSSNQLVENKLVSKLLIENCVLESDPSLSSLKMTQKSIYLVENNKCSKIYSGDSESGFESIFFIPKKSKADSPFKNEENSTKYLVGIESGSDFSSTSPKIILSTSIQPVKYNECSSKYSKVCEPEPNVNSSNQVIRNTDRDTQTKSTEIICNKPVKYYRKHKRNLKGQMSNSYKKKVSQKSEKTSNNNGYCDKCKNKTFNISKQQSWESLKKTEKSENDDSCNWTQYLKLIQRESDEELCRKYDEYLRERDSYPEPVNNTNSLVPQVTPTQLDCPSHLDFPKTPPEYEQNLLFKIEKEEPPSSIPVTGVGPIKSNKKENRFWDNCLSMLLGSGKAKKSEIETVKPNPCRSSMDTESGTKKCFVNPIKRQINSDDLDVNSEDSKKCPPSQVVEYIKDENGTCKITINRLTSVKENDEKNSEKPCRKELPNKNESIVEKICEKEPLNKDEPIVKKLSVKELLNKDEPIVKELCEKEPFNKDEPIVTKLSEKEPLNKDESMVEKVCEQEPLNKDESAVERPIPLKLSQMSMLENNTIKPFSNSHGQTMATIKYAMQDIAGKVYKTTSGVAASAVTRIQTESAKQIEIIKNYSQSDDSELKKYNKENGENKLHKFIRKISESTPEEPAMQKMYSQMADTVSSTVSFLSDSVFSNLRIRSFNDDSSEYDVPNKDLYKRNSACTARQVSNVADSYLSMNTMLTFIKTKIWTMFAASNKGDEILSTNTSETTISRETNESETESDEDLMNKLIE